MAPKFKYNPEQMEEAIKAVKNGSLNITATSKKYGVPRSTLEDKISGKTPQKRKMGPDTILTEQEESDLVEWMFRLSKTGFPVTKEQLLDSVQLLIKSSDTKKEHNFTNGRPGRHWYEGFLKRHPEIAVRISQNLTKSRASVTEAGLRGWFNEVRSYLAEHNLLHILNDMTRVFNCDETAFFLCPKGDQVLVRKGQKSVYSIVNSDEKECLTTLITGNAAGELAPPMIMFKYERLPKNIVASVPGHWGIGKSENGWMTGMNFYEYIVNIFHPWLLKKGIKLPVILFADGHSSHLTKNLSEFCAKNGIILVALYPNSTHTLQLMDVAMFRTLKREWRIAVRSCRMSSNGQRLSKEMFAPILQPVLENMNAQKILANGFRACGLCPFNPDALDYTKLLLKNSSSNEDSGLVEISRNFLRQFEYELGEEKLNIFEKVGRIWTGDVQDESLFYFWISQKQKSGEEIIESHVEVQAAENFISTKGNHIQLGQSDLPGAVHENLIEPTVKEVSLVIDDTELLTLLEKSENLFSKVITEIKAPLTPFSLVNVPEPDDPNLLEKSENSIPQVIPEITAPLNSSSPDNVTEPDEMDVSADKIDVDDRENLGEDALVESFAPDNDELPNKIPERTMDASVFPESEMNIENNSLEIDKENNRAAMNNQRVPSPFKSTLFWPGTSNQKSKDINKRKPKEKLPAVVSSEAWQEYHARKEEKRRALELEKEEKKRKRTQKAEEKRITLEIKKEEREKKRKEKAQALKLKQQEKLKRKEEKEAVNQQLKKIKLEKIR